MLNDLEKLLLSKMPLHDEVRAVLSEHGLNASTLAADVQAIEHRYGPFNRQHLAATYTAMAGEPVLVEPLNPALFPDVTLSVDYTRRCYRLQPWPEVQFSVYEHPNGSAWSARFEPLSAELSTDIEPALVRAWKQTQAELQAASTSVRTLDGWETFILLEFTFFNGSTYEGRFDYGLLQTWNKK